MFSTPAGALARCQNAHAMSETERRCGSYSGARAAFQRRQAECVALSMFITKTAPVVGFTPFVCVASVTCVRQGAVSQSVSSRQIHLGGRQGWGKKQE
jgi:hypothetical protein